MSVFECLKCKKDMKNFKMYIVKRKIYCKDCLLKNGKKILGVEKNEH